MSVGSSGRGVDAVTDAGGMIGIRHVVTVSSERHSFPLEAEGMLAYELAFMSAILTRCCGGGVLLAGCDPDIRTGGHSYQAAKSDQIGSSDREEGRRSLIK